jgi:hypothetical protein
MKRTFKVFSATSAAIVFTLACATMRPAFAQSADATETPIATDTPNATATAVPSVTTTTTTTQQFDYGWVGLLGLFGLIGLARRGPASVTYTRTPPQ